MSHRVSSPTIAGIDLEFRPKSYFWPLSVATHLIARVKGARRKAALQRFLQDGDLARIPTWLAAEGLDETERSAWGRIHPAFLGGEYLPDMLEREVEIARITIASTTQDVTSVYAKRGRRRIYYRVVDEYAGETLSARCTRSSTRPLSLAELECFFNGAWSILDVLEMNFFPEDPGYTEKVTAFASASSAFYPQLGLLYQTRIAAWTAQTHAPICTSISR